MAKRVDTYQVFLDNEHLAVVEAQSFYVDPVSNVAYFYQGSDAIAAYKNWYAITLITPTEVAFV